MTSKYPRQDDIDLSKFNLSEVPNTDPGEVKEILAFAMGLIVEGLADTYLRTVARTCYARRDALTGQQTVFDVPDVGVATLKEPDGTGVDVSAGGLVLQVHPVSPDHHAPTFVHNGYTYRRHDLMGRELLLGGSRYPGYRVRITGLGPKAVHAEWVHGTPPRVRKPDVFVPYTDIEHVLKTQ